MKKTLAALNALTAEQRAVLKDKRLEGSFTPQALLALLKPVSEFDRMSDKSRVSIGCWSAVFFVLAFVCVIVTANGVLPWFLGVTTSDVVRGLPFVLQSLVTGPLYMLLWPATVHLAQRR